MRVRIIAVALAFATAAAAAPVPPLTPQGLGPIRIGMTVRQSERALGARLKVEYPNDWSCGTGGRADGADPDVGYMFDNGRLARIDIGPSGRHPAVHATAAGIHVGSTEADIAKAYGRVVTEPHPYLQNEGHYVRVGGKKAGFLFETDHGRVTTFRAGVYPALGYQEGCV